MNKEHFSARSPFSCYHIHMRYSPDTTSRADARGRKVTMSDTLTADTAAEVAPDAATDYVVELSTTPAPAALSADVRRDMAEKAFADTTVDVADVAKLFAACPKGSAWLDQVTTRTALAAPKADRLDIMDRAEMVAALLPTLVVTSAVDPIAARADYLHTLRAVAAGILATVETELLAVDVAPGYVPTSVALRAGIQSAVEKLIAAATDTDVVVKGPRAPRSDSSTVAGNKSLPADYVDGAEFHRVDKDGTVHTLTISGDEWLVDGEPIEKKTATGAANHLGSKDSGYRFWITGPFVTE